MFVDRDDAGRQLAGKLASYKGRPDVTVVALPRGGVVLGRIIADELQAPLDIVVPRKIGASYDPEYAVGAVTESGNVVWNETERNNLEEDDIHEAVVREQVEAQRRLDVYRAGLPPRDFSGRTVIVVDDGIATGYTMRAALATVRSMKPRRVVVAVPVAPKDALESMRQECDQLVVLETPVLFLAIGSYYSKFDQVSDETVVSLMRHV